MRTAAGTGLAALTGALAGLVLLWMSAYLTLTLGYELGAALPIRTLHVGNPGADTSVTQVGFLAACWIGSLILVRRATARAARQANGLEDVALAIAVVVFGILSAGLGYTLYTWNT